MRIYIAICEGIKENLIAEFGIPEDRISVIYNPVDFNRITELSSESPGHHFFDGSVPVVVAAGRMVPQKGFDVLIKAFSQVVSELEARLIIMGEGPGRESLEQTVRDLGISEKVFFAGFQDNPYKFMSHADVYVLSSRYEGLPMVVLESMVCGVPVIATDCRSGLREILNNGECGILVPPENTTSLAEAMIKLLRDKLVRGKLSSSGKLRALDFSAEIIIRKYEHIISKMLQKP